MPPQYAQTGEGYAVFQVTGIQAATRPTFADWKTHVLDDYRTEHAAAACGRRRPRNSPTRRKRMAILPRLRKKWAPRVKTSDLVTPEGQVPELGQVAQVAPQLLELPVGGVSGPITAERNGVVAKILDKQEPTADEVAKNFDQTRDQILEQRRSDAFNVFLSGIMADYKKNKRIRLNPKAQQGPQIPGM